MKQRGVRAEIAVGLVFVAAWVLVWPVGEYAIDDDWAYFVSLGHLVERGELRILDWNPMSLVGHLAWGALFAEAFGLSFGAARASVLALLCVEVLAFCALARRVGLGEGAVTLAALALVLHPLHFFQTFQYATDVPTAAWSTAALLCYARGLSGAGGPAPGALALGALLATLAALVRQGAIAVAAAPLVYLALYQRPALRDPRVLLALGAIPALGMGAFLAWYQLVHGATATYTESMRVALQGLRALHPANAAFTGYVLLAYTAGFALPLLAALPVREHRPGPGRAGRAAAACAVALLAICAVGTIRFGVTFPYLRNKLTRFGYWSPNDAILGARPVLLPEWACFAASAVLAAAVVAFVLAWSRAARPAPQPARRPALRLVGIALALQLLYAFVTAPGLFDRHLVALAPMALLVAAGGAPPGGRLNLAVGLAVLAPLAFFSVAGTHDAHAFSRAAFRAGEELVSSGVDPACIDAGYAWTGLRMHERSVQELAGGLPSRARTGPEDGARDPWWIRYIAPRVLARFRVSLSQRLDPDAWRGALAPWARGPALMPSDEGYTSVRRLPWRSYWPWGSREIHVLEDPTLAEGCAAEGRDAAHSSAPR